MCDATGHEETEREIIDIKDIVINVHATSHTLTVSDATHSTVLVTETFLV